ncbi:hypothetical protein GCM10010193_63950 [Kitasatospora atroaurantiaca]
METRAGPAPAAYYYGPCVPAPVDLLLVPVDIPRAQARRAVLDHLHMVGRDCPLRPGPYRRVARW